MVAYYYAKIVSFFVYDKNCTKVVKYMYIYNN